MGQTASGSDLIPVSGSDLVYRSALPAMQSPLVQSGLYPAPLPSALPAVAGPAPGLFLVPSSMAPSSMASAGLSTPVLGLPVWFWVAAGGLVYWLWFSGGGHRGRGQ